MNKPGTVEYRIVTGIIRVLGVDRQRVTPEARFEEDLKADSLDMINLIMWQEDEFGLDVSVEDGEKFLTVYDMLAYFNERADKANAL